MKRYALIGFLCATGCGPDAASVGNRLTPAPEVLDLGTVAAEASVTRDLVLVAAPGTDVTVNAMDIVTDAAGTFTVAGDSTFTVERGTEIQLPISFSSADLGIHTGQLVLETTGDPAEVRVELRAYVGTPSLDFDRQIVDFGDVAVGTTRTVRLGLANDGTVAATLTNATFTGPFSAASEIPFVAPAGIPDFFELSFTPTSTDAVAGSVAFAAASGETFTVALRGNDCINGEPTAYDLDRDGVTTCGGDCDDTRTLAYPGAAELANGVDDDCDGVADEGTPLGDNDGDGYTPAEGDCNDFAAAAHPAATELADGIDNDCDGTVDDGTSRGDDDSDGSTEEGGDCNDADAAIGPHALEIPGNAVDEDCNPATL